jgi:hypothetical protein
LASQERIQKLLTMCEKTMSDNDLDESTKSHAAKMIEGEYTHLNGSNSFPNQFKVFILQCQGHIDALLPSILQLVFNQLQQPINESTTLDHYKPQLLMVYFHLFYS